MTEDWGDAYLSHYETYFGKPLESRVFNASGGPRIQILAYDKVFSQCRVFATLGLTHFANAIGDVGEVYMPVDAAWELVPQILANALFHIVSHQMTLGYGISIAGIETVSLDFSSKYGKSAVYLANPYGLPRDFSKIAFREEIGSIYLAILLTKEEHAYFQDHGSRHLETILKEKKVDPYNIARPSCV